MELQAPQLILILGVLVLLAVLMKHAARYLRAPALVGFLLLGFGLRLIDVCCPWFDEAEKDVFAFLGYLGVICLLFRVGLDTDVQGLRNHLGEAGIIWIFNFLLSGVFGFLAAYVWLRVGLIPSLFAGVALTATSVGVTVPLWQQTDALQTPTGETLIDVAELDDLSGVIAMALLFGLVPLMQDGAPNGLAVPLLKQTGWILLKLIAFGGACILFSRYAEKRVTAWCGHLRPRPDPMLFLVALVLATAAIAAWLGFSFAIGAFFAGLVFSRDPQATRMERSFDALHALFVPFFFIHLGLLIEPASLATGAGWGAVLLAAAVLGKVLGAYGPARPLLGRRAAGLIAVSLIPRAEICMVVMLHGRQRGAVPPQLFSAAVVVVALTCVLTPLGLHRLLERWGPKTQDQTVAE